MIHVTSAWSHEYAPLAELTWKQSKVPYAKRWGLKTRFYIHPDANKGDIAWNRAEIFYDTLNKIPEGDVLFWSGCDAAITNHDLNVSDFIKPDEDFCFSIDNFSQAVFADCFLLRSNARTKHMLKRMLGSKLRSRGGNEQDAFTEYLCQGMMLDYTRNLRANYGSDEKIEATYQKAEKLLSRSGVKIRVFRKADKFCGDPHFVWAHGEIPAQLSWEPGHLVLHLGGKSLPFRLAFFPAYI